jgi:putative phosphoribosyl transferase
MAEDSVRVNAAGAELEGDLSVPRGAAALILFAHGSGSSRWSPRNRKVAQILREGGLATLLIDLLTAEEEQVDLATAELRFNIGLLAERLAGAADWLRANRETSGLRIGFFGASTGAGAALVAAAARPEAAEAIVSRGGRPDLAGDALEYVRAPTLLLVGALDAPVIHLNREAFNRLHCEKRLEIIPNASHLFEEAGALEKVAQLAREWFQLHLVGRARTAGH